jgi:hypothetical protein
MQTRHANRLAGGSTITLAYVTPGASSREVVLAARRKTPLPRAARNQRTSVARLSPVTAWRTRIVRRTRPGPRLCEPPRILGSTVATSTRLVSEGTPSLTTRRRVFRFGRIPVKLKLPSSELVVWASVE